MLKREPFFLIFLVIVTAIIQFLVFGIAGFQIDNDIDINIHDTYFILSGLYMLLGIFTLLLFLGYGIKLLIFKNSGVIPGILFILSCILILLFLSELNPVFNSQNLNIEPLGSNSAIFGNDTLIKVLNSMRLFILILLLVVSLTTGKKIVQIIKR